MALIMTLEEQRDAMNQFDAMMEWENGELDQNAEVELFQGLVDSGLAWQLQGMYGRHAMALIDAGLVTRHSVAA